MTKAGDVMLSVIMKVNAPSAVGSSALLGCLSSDIKSPYAVRELSSRKCNNSAGAANLINVEGEVLLIAWILDVDSLFGVCPFVLPNIEAVNLERLTVRYRAEELPIRICTHDMRSSLTQKL